MERNDLELWVFGGSVGYDTKVSQLSDAVGAVAGNRDKSGTRGEDDEVGVCLLFADEAQEVLCDQHCAADVNLKVVPPDLGVGGRERLVTAAEETGIVDKNVNGWVLRGDGSKGGFDARLVGDLEGNFEDFYQRVYALDVCFRLNQGGGLAGGDDDGSGTGESEGF